MIFQVVKDLRRFADEESETLGRDVLRRQLHKFAERVDETIENITAHYSRRIAKQAGVMAETADRNVYLSSKLKNVEQMLEREIACRQPTPARCEMCHEDASAGEDCPYNGEPNGCNSPIYGEFPTEKECEPFVEILAAIREEGGENA